MSCFWRTCEDDADFERQTVTLHVSVLLTQQMVSTAAFVTVTTTLTVPANGRQNDHPHTVEPVSEMTVLCRSDQRHWFRVNMFSFHVHGRINCLYLLRSGLFWSLNDLSDLLICLEAVAPKLWPLRYHVYHQFKCLFNYYQPKA